MYQQRSLIERRFEWAQTVFREYATENSHKNLENITGTRVYLQILEFHKIYLYSLQFIHQIRLLNPLLTNITAKEFNKKKFVDLFIDYNWHLHHLFHWRLLPKYMIIILSILIPRTSIFLEFFCINSDWLELSQKAMKNFVRT